MPIGNLSSQIFANIYLNELDQFIKHTLHVKYYFRYADDFLIVHSDEEYLKSLIKDLVKLGIAFIKNQNKNSPAWRGSIKLMSVF